MKRFVALVIVCALASGAWANPENFGGSGEEGAWSDSGTDHYTNDNNGEVRMDWDGHRFAVPGEGGPNADNAHVQPHRNQTLVDPHDTLD